MNSSIKKLDINSRFSTTVEIFLNEKSSKVLIFSHGFGVQRHSRGMFTDIVNTVSNDFNCVLFDYVDIDSDGNTTVLPLSVMKITLEAVIAYVEETFPNSEIHILGHSLGGVIAGMIDGHNMKSVLMLAPPPVTSFERQVRAFKDREGTIIDFEGKSVFLRSNGKKTFVTKEYFDELKVTVPEKLYERLASETKVTILSAENDSIITDSYDDLKNIGLDLLSSIPGNHDFHGQYRQGMLEKVTAILC